MRKPQFTSAHENDANGNPAGGSTQGNGFHIQWQNGPLAVDGVRIQPNGAFVEDVLAGVIDRVRYYQQASNGKFACRQNALAITHMEEALNWMHNRTAEREERGVEGTHTP